MECEVRQSTTDLINNTLKGDTPFAFYQTVRALLEHDKSKLSPGQQGSIRNEAVLFRSNVSLGFPKGDIEDIRSNENESCGLPPIEMVVNFLGLYGQASPLPTYITEDILHGDRDDSNVRHFLDIFNHRLISFLFRSWEKYRYIEQYEPGATDQFSDKIFAFAGLQQKALRQKSNLDWERLLPFIGVLGMKVRSAWVLETVVKNYFGVVKVQIGEFVESSLEIEKSDQNELGVRNIVLGQECSLGKKVRDCSGKFKIRMGPLKYKQYKSFLPNGRNHKELHQLIDFVISEPMEYDIELILSGKNVPRAALTSANIFSLGINSWVGKPKQENTIVRL